MRLSEAIRLGAMLRPQAFRPLFTDDGACALGAALLAVGARPERIGAAFSQCPWERSGWLEARHAVSQCEHANPVEWSSAGKALPAPRSRSGLRCHRQCC